MRFISLRGNISEEVINEMFNDIHDFIVTDPGIPDSEKEYSKTSSLCISTLDSREMIIEKIYSSMDTSELSLLSVYVYRDMDKIDWLPFYKSCYREKSCML